MSNFTSWFETFREEKNYGEKTYNVFAGGQHHFIPTAVVEESILNASTGEQSFIKETLVKIDFHNGNVHHFFEHLATCLAREYAAA